MQRIELKTGPVTKRIEAFNKTAEDANKIDITGNQSKQSGLYGYYQRTKTKIKFSGFGSRNKDGTPFVGHIAHNGSSIEDGKNAARAACLNFINNIATACDGSLDDVTKIQIRVDVSCDPAFRQHPTVADGASELLIQVFGEYVGKPNRTAAGASSLPNDMLVEVTGEIEITHKLAAVLDLRDARDLANDLLSTKMLSDEGKKFIVEFSIANELTKQHRFNLHECVEDVLSKLKDTDLSDKITWKANNLRLDNPKIVHSNNQYSSMFNAVKHTGWLMDRDHLNIGATAVVTPKR